MIRFLRHTGSGVVLLLLFAGPLLYGQKDRKMVREGNRDFQKEKYSEAEVNYRKAVEISKMPFKPEFNIGDALYKQKKYEEAFNQFSDLSQENGTKTDKAKIYHNIGNSLLQQQKLKESIEAYKEALRNNPGDLETKYNLAWAQDKLKKQKQQQKKQKKNQNNKNQDKKDQQKQQNKDQNKNQQDQQKKQQDQNKNQDQQKQQPKPAPGQISKQDALRILQAMQNDEKKVQEKVKKAKAAKTKVKTNINW